MRHAAASTTLLCWLLSATVVRVVDGDTFVAQADLFVGLTQTITVRLLGVDTPERKGPTLQVGEAARLFTAKWLDQGDVELAGCRLDAFGRFLAIVKRGNESLAEELIKAGHGTKR